ncbi:hypothetical protein AB0G74_11050 [Streptomyces sp. NPDC020875]|uniref:hypothetical protein n=1 Tax=Streptomyces sp. NPDC020875 TaxID=3154898 RepID=UPI0033EDD329
MRSLLSTVLIALVAVLTPLSALAVWADREIGDADGYVTAMAPLAADREVGDVIAARIADEVLARLGGRLDGSGGGGTDSDTRSGTGTGTGTDEDSGSGSDTGSGSGIGTGSGAGEGPGDRAGDAELWTLVYDAVLSFATTDAYRTAWNSVNQAAHTAVEKALTGYDGSTASIDLAPVTEELKARLSRDGVPYAERIPVGDTRIVVLESERLGVARELFDGLQSAGVALPLLTLLLAVSALVAAPRRVPELAVALAVGGALLLAVVALARRLALDDPALRLYRPAAGAAVDALTASLWITAWCLVGGGALVVAAVYRGRRRRRVARDAGGAEAVKAEGETTEAAS